VRMRFKRFDAKFHEDYFYSFLSTQRMSSINSRCATFTSEADGFVPSDGAVALVLKTRDSAVRDGDNILGTVMSTGVQHDGRSQGLIAPNINSQVSLQRSLLSEASIHPSEVECV
jgi:acyl transferase domain-containing protein